MMGVRFTKPMSPYGAGDPALLPETVARRLISQGAAEPHTFPDRPFASEAIAPPAPTSDREPPAPARRGGSYRVKG